MIKKCPDSTAPHTILKRYAKANAATREQGDKNAQEDVTQHVLCEWGWGLIDRPGELGLQNCLPISHVNMDLACGQPLSGLCVASVALIFIGMFHPFTSTAHCFWNEKNCKHTGLSIMNAACIRHCHHFSYCRWAVACRHWLINSLPK